MSRVNRSPEVQAKIRSAVYARFDELLLRLLKARAIDFDELACSVLGSIGELGPLLSPEGAVRSLIVESNSEARRLAGVCTVDGCDEDPDDDDEDLRRCAFHMRAEQGKPTS